MTRVTTIPLIALSFAIGLSACEREDTDGDSPQVETSRQDNDARGRAEESEDGEGKQAEPAGEPLTIPPPTH